VLDSGFNLWLGNLGFKELIEIFFTVHDPTTLDRQGTDVGTQYRSVIFYRTKEQEKVAREVIKELEVAKIWSAPIVTELAPFKVFYPAEEYHQEYFRRNPDQMYCSAVISPKVARFRKRYSAMLRNK